MLHSIGKSICFAGIAWQVAHQISIFSLILSEYLIRDTITVHLNQLSCCILNRSGHVNTENSHEYRNEPHRRQSTASVSRNIFT